MLLNEKAIIDFRSGMSKKNILKKYGEFGIFSVDMSQKRTRNIYSKQKSNTSYRSY